MKIAVLIARILFGLIFFVFGLNNILHFIPMHTPPPSDAASYSAILGAHGVMKLVGVLMVISGLLLLVGRFVPLALVLAGPILVNILIYHFLIEGNIPGAGLGLLLTVLELFLIVAYRQSFRGLFDAAPESV